MCFLVKLRPVQCRIGTCPLLSRTFATKFPTKKTVRITGDDTSAIDSCHIVAFSMSNTTNPRLANYIDLVRAMFGEAAWLALLTNVVDGSSDQGGRNINRLDNGIPMTPSCHRAWDTMAFVLVVDWSTYNSETKEVWRYPIRPVGNTPLTSCCA
jgi:hypothetical protein